MPKEYIYLLCVLRKSLKNLSVLEFQNAQEIKNKNQILERVHLIEKKVNFCF